MTKYFCDHCKKELIGKWDYRVPAQLIINIGTVTILSQVICNQCKEKFKKYMKGWNHDCQ